MQKGNYNNSFEAEVRQAERDDCRRVVSSVGLEHHVDNVRVAGSNPAQPTIFLSIPLLQLRVSSINYRSSKASLCLSLVFRPAGLAGNSAGAIAVALQHVSVSKNQNSPLVAGK